MRVMQEMGDIPEIQLAEMWIGAMRVDIKMIGTGTMIGTEAIAIEIVTGRGCVQRGTVDRVFRVRGSGIVEV